MIAHIHRCIDRRQEELDPKDIPTAGQFGVGLHQQGEGLAMAELIIAPFTEPFENRMEAQFRVLLKVAEDRDIARIADLFRQIGRVIDEFRLEISVFLGLSQKAEINRNPRLAEGIIDETRMARFIAGHELEQGGDILIGPAALHFLIEHTTRKLGSAGRDQKIDEFGLEFGLHAVPINLVPILSFLEMALIRVCFHLSDQGVPFLANGADINRIQLIEIGGVKPRCQKGVLQGKCCCAFAIGDGLVVILGGQRLFDGACIGGVVDLNIHTETSSEKLNSQSSMNSKSPVARVQSCSSFEARLIVAMRSSVTTSP